MPRRDCPSDQELLAFHLGTAPPDALDGLAEHVESCGRCETALQRLDGRLDPVLAALRRPATVGGPPGPGPEPADREAPTVIRGPEPPALLLPVQAGDASSRREREIRTTLQNRLAALLPICGVVWGNLLVVSLAHPLFSREYVGWAGQILLGVATAVSAGCAAVLWARPGLALPWLRRMELVAVTVFAGVLVSFRISFLSQTLPVAAAASDSPNFLLYWRTVFNGFGWASLIVIYGVCFPNTWRRVAAVVLGLTLVPLAIDAGFALYDPAWLRPLVYPLLMTAQMLLVAVGIALFGSYKIGALQQEVYRARQEARAARALGPYVLKRRLGGGGMGEVYLAEHRLLKRPCALKLIRPERVRDPEMLARFDREAQATARLVHPNTVEVFDYGRTDDGTFYYVMEYLEGLSLEELVNRHGPLPPARVVHVLRRLCGALHEAHSVGLIHRDIKPGNVLMCRHGGFHGVVKLVDFGLVQTAVGGPEAARLTHADAILGTPEYMSPEQANGASLDARSDLYSLGATAYFLLTGRAPFAGGSVLDVLLAHRRQPVPPLAAPAPVPADLGAVVHRCLAKDPAARPASADELDRALLGCGLSEAWTEEEARAWWASHVAPPRAPEG
jgi:eukaryotic-like serine/threonine-protein kinase